MIDAAENLGYSDRTMQTLSSKLELNFKSFYHFEALPRNGWGNFFCNVSSTEELLFDVLISFIELDFLSLLLDIMTSIEHFFTLNQLKYGNLFKNGD